MTDYGLNLVLMQDGERRDAMLTMVLEAVLVFSNWRSPAVRGAVFQVYRGSFRW
jgi:hypothetical protein